MSGHVFSRASSPEPAGRRRPPTAPRSWTPTAASTSTPPAGRSSSTSATGAARSRTSWPSRPPASPTRTARPSRARPLERYAAAVGQAPADGRAGDLPGERRVRGHRDRAQAGPRHAARPRRGGPDRSSSRAGAATTATRSAPSTCPVASRCAGRTRPWLGRFRHVSAAYPYRGGEPGSQRPRRRPRRWPTELDAAIVEAGPRNVAAFVARADRGRDAGRRRAAGGLLAGHRGGLPPARRAADRRRGHDRVRAHRAPGSAMDHCGVRPDILVAAKGATQRLLAVRLRGGLGRACTTPSARGGGFVHGFTYSHQPGGGRGGPRGAADPRGGVAGRGVAVKGERLQALLRERLGDHPAVGDIRGRGPAWSAWSWSATGRRRRRTRGRRSSIESVVRIARERGLLLYSGSGNANGIDGDVVLLGPPFVITDGRARPRRGRPARALDAALAAPAGRARLPGGDARLDERARTQHAARPPAGCGQTRSLKPGTAQRRRADRPRGSRPGPPASPSRAPLAARTRAMNRNATPRHSVPTPGPLDDARASSRSGRGERRDDRRRGRASPSRG